MERNSYVGIYFLLIMVVWFFGSYFKNIKLPNKTSLILSIKDLSLWSLLITNLLILINVMVGKMDFYNLLWIYWWQTGFFIFFLILKLATGKTKLWWKIFWVFFSGSAAILLMIWGASLLNETIGLMARTPYLSFISNIGVNTKNHLVMIIILLINGLFSFIYNRKNDREINYSGKMAGAIKRVYPIALGVVAYQVGLDFGNLGIIVFILVKTTVDLVSHLEEHKLV